MVTNNGNMKNHPQIVIKHVRVRAHERDCRIVFGRNEFSVSAKTVNVLCSCANSNTDSSLGPVSANGIRYPVGMKKRFPQGDTCIGLRALSVVWIYRAPTQKG